jgi:hypothetical protein
MSYGVTRVNGFSQFVAGTLVSVAQLKAIKIELKNASDTAIDVSALDDGSEELVELIVREVQPLMYFLAGTGSTGIIHAIVDGHAVDAASLTDRVKNIVIGYGSYGTMATNDSVVTVGTGITVA